MTTAEKLTREMIDVLDLDACMALRVELVAQLAEIDAQLSARVSERLAPTRAERDVWWSWSSKAKAARSFRMRDLVLTNQRIKVLRAAAHLGRMADEQAAAELRQGCDEPSERKSGDLRARRREAADARFAAAYEQMALNPNDTASVLPALYDVAQFVVDQTDWALSEDEKAVLTAAQRLVRGVR
jgi:hypothetical protein